MSQKDSDGEHEGKQRHQSARTQSLQPNRFGRSGWEGRDDGIAQISHQAAVLFQASSVSPAKCDDLKQWQRFAKALRGEFLQRASNRAVGSDQLRSGDQQLGVVDAKRELVCRHLAGFQTKQPDATLRIHGEIAGVQLLVSDPCAVQ